MNQILQTNIKPVMNSSSFSDFLDLPNKKESLFHSLANGHYVQPEKSVERSKLKRLISLPSYYWILLSMLVVVTPHFNFMPFWLVSYSIFSIIMQLPIIKFKFKQSKNIELTKSYRLIQLTAFLFSVIGLWYTFGGFNVETGVAFLLLCLASKLWEMYSKRDAFIILNLSLFVCASLFLVDQGLSNSIFAFFAIISVLMTFIAMNDDDNIDGSGRIRSLALLSTISIPLMVILFIFFPRLPPLWSLKLSSGQAKTGMSDSMSPGDIASLSQSTELAFRIEFSGEIPQRHNMYWRGLVFSDFDGKTWRPNHQSKSVWNTQARKPNWLIEAANSSNQPTQNYKVILEPTNQNWLFALDYPINIEEKGMDLTSNFTLQSWNPIVQQKHYKINYKPSTKISRELSKYEKQINLSLPSGNDQSRLLAKQLYKKAGQNPIAYANAIDLWIKQSKFSYTLSPPKLGQNRIDEFLFNTRAGFCEHYSSSFTFLMRSVGIPSRVVAGYQGGKLGRDGESWEVRQMDAHAWSEIWVKGMGWVRIDPTSFVSPERVEQGMGDLAASQGPEMFGDGISAQLTYQQFKMLQEIRQLSDQLSYYWQRDIVGYDQDSQSNSLLKWFNIKSLYQQVMWMMIISISIVGLITLWLWFQRREKWHIADEELMKLSKKLQKEETELNKLDSEGMLMWIDRLAANSDQEQANICHEIQRQYRKIRYGKMSSSNIKSKEYRLEVDKLNRMIKMLSFV